MKPILNKEQVHLEGSGHIVPPHSSGSPGRGGGVAAQGFCLFIFYADAAAVWEKLRDGTDAGGALRPAAAAATSSTPGF